MAFMVSNIYAQYPPPAGEEGSTAIHWESSLFIDWASGCEVQRGYVDISDPSLGTASYGSDTNGIGLLNNTIVSIGDGGIATLTFSTPLADGNGWDFAVFENSFSDSFLELAFVEVSSDGTNFFRFPSVSLTQDTAQIESFGELDATKINNLAGKYRAGFGVPFDLFELAGTDGLNINNIISIRIIDVVGSINQEYASVDSQGNIINDPWPTPFESSGFDLDAIGVIHNRDNTSVDEKIIFDPNLVYPVPAKNHFHIKEDTEFNAITIYDISGIKVLSTDKQIGNKVDIGHLIPGFYMIMLHNEEKIISGKLLKQ